MDGGYMLSESQIAALTYLLQMDHRALLESSFIVLHGKQVLLQLKAAKYIQQKTIVMPNGDWQNGVLITTLGAQELLAAQNHLYEVEHEENNRAAEHNREEVSKRKEARRTFWGALLIALITCALTLFADHFNTVWGFIRFLWVSLFP